MLDSPFVVQLQLVPCSLHRLGLKLDMSLGLWVSTAPLTKLTSQAAEGDTYVALVIMKSKDILIEAVFEYNQDAIPSDFNVRSEKNQQKKNKKHKNKKNWCSVKLCTLVQLSFISLQNIAIC